MKFSSYIKKFPPRRSHEEISPLISSSHKNFPPLHPQKKIFPCVHEIFPLFAHTKKNSSSAPDRIRNPPSPLRSQKKISPSVPIRKFSNSYRSHTNHFVFIAFIFDRSISRVLSHFSDDDVKAIKYYFALTVGLLLAAI